MLIDADEMESLFEALGDFEIFHTGCISHKGEGHIPRREFLKNYREYIETLKRGELPEDAQHRFCFSSVFTRTTDCLFAVPIGDDSRLIRVAKPVIQLQLHRMDYSSDDGKFRPMVMGEDTIVWGLQFSYPHLCMENGSKEVEKVTDCEEFPNTSLFHALQQWMRRNTLPTPFLVDGKRVNVPIKIGKGVLSWINDHPQLMKKGLRVETTL